MSGTRANRPASPPEPAGAHRWTPLEIALVEETAERTWAAAERARAEAALCASEARFRTLADSIPQLAWMTNADGWIFWYSRRWFDYTGETFEAMEGWGWQKVQHPDHVDRVVAGAKRCFETGEPWEDTFPLRRRDGGFRWFLSRALPIRDESGRIVRWFGTNTDVTDSLEKEGPCGRPLNGSSCRWTPARSSGRGSGPLRTTA